MASGMEHTLRIRASHHWAHAVGQDMLKDNAGRAGATALDRLYKLLIAQVHDRRSHHAGEMERLGNGQRNEQLVRTVSQCGYHGHG